MLGLNCGRAGAYIRRQTQSTASASGVCKNNDYYLSFILRILVYNVYNFLYCNVVVTCFNYNIINNYNYMYNRIVNISSC